MKSKLVPDCFLFLAFVFAAPLFGQNYEVYISDAGNYNLPPWQILKFDQNGGNGSKFITDHLDWPQDIFFLENESAVLVTNLNSGNISKFDAVTGAFLSEFATGLGGPTRMSLGPDSLLYVLQWQGTGKVKRFKLDGTSLGDFTATGVGTAIGLDWDDAGNLYVSSYNGKYVRKFDTSGADLGNFVNSNLGGPTNIWFADNGDLMVMDYNNGTVKRFDSSGNFVSVFISGLPQGEGVAFTPTGEILLGCGGTSSVRRYNADGTLIGDLVPPSTLDLLTPNAVVLHNISPSATKDFAKDTTFVTPSVGVSFRMLKEGASASSNQVVDVFNSAGILVQKINFADSTVWDASHLPDGMYHLVSKQKSGTLGRQQIVVQH